MEIISFIIQYSIIGIECVFCYKIIKTPHILSALEIIKWILLWPICGAVAFYRFLIDY